MFTFKCASHEHGSDFYFYRIFNGDMNHIKSKMFNGSEDPEATETRLSHLSLLVSS